MHGHSLLWVSTYVGRRVAFTGHFLGNILRLLFLRENKIDTLSDREPITSRRWKSVGRGECTDAPIRVAFSKRMKYRSFLILISLVLGLVWEEITGNRGHSFIQRILGISFYNNRPCIVLYKYKAHERLSYSENNPESSQGWL